MKTHSKTHRDGFSLIETMIAIGVLAVLLTGFLIVFAPAASSIRKSLNSQDAARMVATLEQELVTLHGTTQTTEYATGFHKAFDYIRASNPGGSGGDVDKALLIYKYRASLNNSPPREDGTPWPLEVVGDKVAGVDYVVRNMVRRKGEAAFLEDLPATEGPIYLIKCTQLLQSNTTTELVLGIPGQIANASAPTTPVATADDYRHAVITFTADFYAIPGKAEAYFSSPTFQTLYDTASRPLFSRNLAVRR